MIAPQIKPRKSTEIRVYLVEDQALLRQTLRAMLELEGGISVVGESETADHAIHAIDAKDVDLVVMDLQMPGMTGIEATRVLQDFGIAHSIERDLTRCLTNCSARARYAPPEKWYSAPPASCAKC